MEKRKMYKLGETPMISNQNTSKDENEQRKSEVVVSAIAKKNRQCRPMAGYDGKSIAEIQGIVSARTPKEIGMRRNDIGTVVEDRIKTGMTKFFNDELEAKNYARQTRSYAYPVYKQKINLVGWGVPK